MNITPNAIIYFIFLTIVAGMVVWALSEMTKKLRLRILSLELEIQKARKVFEKQQKHKRKMYKETYLKLPISKKEKEYS